MDNRSVQQSKTVLWDSREIAARLKQTKREASSSLIVEMYKANVEQAYAALTGNFVGTGGFMELNSLVCGKTDAYARAHGCFFSGYGVDMEAFEQNASFRVLVKNTQGHRLCFLCTDKLAPLSADETPFYLKCQTWSFFGPYPKMNQSLAMTASEIASARKGDYREAVSSGQFTHLIGVFAQSGMMGEINAANRTHKGQDMSFETLDGSIVETNEKDGRMSVRLTGASADLTFVYTDKDGQDGLYRQVYVSDPGKSTGCLQFTQGPNPAVELIQSISRSIHAERQAYVMDRKGSMPQWHPSMAFKAG